MDRLAATCVFVTVVEQGSLTLAAERLDMSTAMVSRYLAAMEAWLGTRLLHRTTRRLSLTEAGEAALASCRQLLDLSADVEERAGRAHREPSGRLRLTCSPSFADTQLAPALMDFQRLHPRVAFTLMVADRSVDLTAERIDLAGDDLRAGRLVAVLPDHEPEPLGVHAVYLSRQHQPLALRLLLDFLAARFDGAPWDAVRPG